MGDVVSKRRDKFKDVIFFPLPKRFSEETVFRDGNFLAVHRYFDARRRDSVEFVDDDADMGGRSIFGKTSYDQADGAVDVLDFVEDFPSRLVDDVIVEGGFRQGRDDASGDFHWSSVWFEEPRFIGIVLGFGGG